MIDIAEPQFETLTCTARVVIAVIANMMMKGERITMDAIADRAGMCKGTVVLCVRMAERRGLVKIDRSRLPFGYTFTDKAVGVSLPMVGKTS